MNNTERAMTLNPCLRSSLNPLKKPAPKARRIRPAIEILEDRLAPAVFLVNSALDSDNGLALGIGPTTLRKAIRLANATVAADTIQFSAALANQTIPLNG